MQATPGFKPLTTSTTISLTPNQSNNSSNMTNSSNNNNNLSSSATSDKPHPLPLQRALFEQPPTFRRPTNLQDIPSAPPATSSTLQSPAESLASVPTPSSSSLASSGYNSLSRPMMYPTYSGVDQLILAAQIDATQNVMSNFSNPNARNPNFNFLYNNPAVTVTAPYIPPNTAWYQSLLQHQQHQVQQQQQQSLRDAGFPSSAPRGQPDPQIAGGGQFSRHTNPVNQPAPKSPHERELYDLLKQANLLDYFAKFIKFGGDDVQQLADADEVEFVEIMELVEMNYKPLHMRRMQKALEQWRQDKNNTFEAEENFKKPKPLYDSGFDVNPAGHDHSSQFDLSLRSDSSFNDSPATTSTRASRALFPHGSDKLSNNVLESPQQYCTPHEVIKNAPKKPRLMDSIVPSDLTKGVHLEDDPFESIARQMYLGRKFLGSSAGRNGSNRRRYHPNGEAQDFSGYSPPESPATSASLSSRSSSSASSVSSVASDSDLIEVEVPDKKPTGTNKRKRGLKKQTVAHHRKNRGITGPQVNPENNTTAQMEAPEGPADK